MVGSHARKRPTQWRQWQRQHRRRDSPPTPTNTIHHPTSNQQATNKQQATNNKQQTAHHNPTRRTHKSLTVWVARAEVQRSLKVPPCRLKIGFHVRLRPAQLVQQIARVNRRRCGQLESPHMHALSRTHTHTRGCASCLRRTSVVEWLSG